MTIRTNTPAKIPKKPMSINKKTPVKKEGNFIVINQKFNIFYPTVLKKYLFTGTGKNKRVIKSNLVKISETVDQSQFYDIHWILYWLHFCKYYNIIK